LLAALSLVCTLFLARSLPRLLWSLFSVPAFERICFREPECQCGGDGGPPQFAQRRTLATIVLVIVRCSPVLNKRVAGRIISSQGFSPEAQTRFDGRAAWMILKGEIAFVQIGNSDRQRLCARWRPPTFRNVYSPKTPQSAHAKAAHRAK
jgi:hypothetical protein